MASEWLSCKGACSGSDPVSDTVKVDLSKLASGKENVQPAPVRNKVDQAQKDYEAAAEKQRLRLRAERERAEREAAADAQRLCVELAAAEQQAAAAERRRQEQEEAARAAALEEAERQRREAEELEALRAQQLMDQMEERAAEVRRQEEEEERQRLEIEQKDLDTEKVRQFLAEHGYSGLNAKRTKMMKSKYALHTAVKLADQEMVLLLLAFRADPSLKSSAGETPKQLALKLNKNGSHDGVHGVLP